jgi:hypothetical protein
LSLFLLIILLILVLLSFLSSNDLFSPLKLYLFALIFNFLNIFVFSYTKEVNFIYFLYIICGYLFLIIERKCLKKQSFFISSTVNVSFFKLNAIIWGLSLIPVFANLYLIHNFGGFENYFKIIALRVERFSGFGHIIIFKQFILPINLIYFLILFKKYGFNLFNFNLYAFHLILVIINGLLSGSRGSTLVIFVYLIVVFNICFKRLKLFHTVVPLIILFILSSFLGDVRDNSNYSTSNFKTNVDKSIVETISSTKTFSYGLYPIKFITDKEFSDLQFGTTLLSAVTIYIPRKLWPDKLLTGGQVLTGWKSNRSLANYSSTMNFSPGLFTELILNFGYFFGVLLFFIILVSTFIYVCYIYNIINQTKLLCYKSLVLLCFYLQIYMWPGGFLVGEFTTMSKGALFNLFFFYITLLLLKLKYNVWNIRILR